MTSLGIAFVAILVLREVLHFQNKQRDSQQNVNIDPESREAIDIEELSMTTKDETDWENPRFRYYL